MLHELMSLFRSQSPLQAMGDNFKEMLALSMEMTRTAGVHFFAQTITPEERTLLQKQDVRVNKLQRKIRKQVIVHLAMKDNQQDLPYCLLLMNLVKDVERIGDYAKELAGLINLTDEPWPESMLMAELMEIRSGVENDYEGAVEAVQSADHERAIELIHCGRDTVDRTGQLMEKIADSDLPTGIAVTAVLGVRFYERIAGHVLNLLSGVVMPLHKLDYYDEKDIAKAEKKLQDK